MLKLFSLTPLPGTPRMESIHPSLVAGWAVFDPFASKFVFIFSKGQIYDIGTETLSLPDSGFDNISMVSKPPSKCIQKCIVFNDFWSFVWWGTWSWNVWAVWLKQERYQTSDPFGLNKTLDASFGLNFGSNGATQIYLESLGGDPVDHHWNPFHKAT